jgi:hypothetical protein
LEVSRNVSVSRLNTHLLDIGEGRWVDISEPHIVHLYTFTLVQCQVLTLARNNGIITISDQDPSILLLGRDPANDS